MQKFEIEYRAGRYFVNGRDVDGAADGAVYFIRHMCNIPPGKRPTCADARAVCNAAKLSRDVCTLTVT